MAKIEQIEQVDVGSLIPYINNAKGHSDEQITKIAASIREFGFVNPVLIDKDLNVIAGHGRIMAAKKLGLSEVPCLYIEGLSEAQRKAYILADNRLSELAEWDMKLVRSELEALQELDFDIDLTGFELPEEEEISREVEEDEIPEDVETRAKLGDLWKLGGHRLVCGDSTDVNVIERLMDGASADLLLTDPPYNVALGHHMRPSEAKQLHRRTDGLVIENDAFDNEEDFTHFLESAFFCANNALKPGGVFYIWHAHNWSKQFFEAAQTVGWQIRQCLVWNKSTFALGRQDYQWKHEPCLYGWKDGAAHYFIDDRCQSTVFQDKEEIAFEKMKKAELVKLIKDMVAEKVSTTVICEDKPSRSEDHPTMKPIKLLARQIKNSTMQKQSVLDVFGGSGSTLIACEQLNRKCYMCELDPHYVDVIIQRWENLTGQKAELINE